MALSISSCLFVIFTLFTKDFWKLRI